MSRSAHERHAAGAVRALGAAVLWAPLWIPIGLSAACAGEPTLPAALFQRELFSLLDGERLELVEHGGDLPPRVELVTPSNAHARQLGTAPAIVLAPPAVLRARLPHDLPPRARLELALALHPDSYAVDSTAAVRLRVALDGVVRAEPVRRAGAAVRPPARAWEEFELDVERGQELELSAEFDGEPCAATRVAFGRLIVTAPVETRRVAASRERPNLVLLVIDTLRADRLGTYGYGRETSPILDALAARGVVFERAFAPSPWTWPSTASLLTGLDPPEHGVLDFTSCWLAGELRTLAEHLRDAGFATAAGSANPLVIAGKNFHRGFDEFHEVHRADAWKVLARVEPWLRARGPERFFLYLHLFEPHAPYEPRSDTHAPWLDGVSAPEGWRRDAVAQILRRRYSGEVIDGRQLERLVEHASDLYDGEIATVDRALGDLVALLTELGVLERTLIAVTSDHGEEFLEHGQYGHTKQLHVESVRVPLILAGPGLEPARFAEPVDLTSLPGTLLECLGVPRGAFPSGPNLLDPRERAAARPIFASTQKGTWIDADGLGRGGVAPTHAVRLGDELLIWRPAHPGDPLGEALRLFDLARDPLEQEDLAARRPERTRALRQLIAEWLAQGAARRPYAVHGGAETIEQLRALGYIDDQD